MFTQSRLAGAMGGSRMTLHRKGVTRELVIELLRTQAAEEYQLAVWPAMTSTGTAAERLELVLEAICKVADHWRDLLVGLFAEDGGVFHDPDQADDASGQDAAIATRAVFVDPLARLLRDGAQDGSLAVDDDPERVATVLFNQVGWTFLALRVGQRWPGDQATSSVVNMALRAVLSADADADRAVGRRTGA